VHKLVSEQYIILILCVKRLPNKLI